MVVGRARERKGKEGICSIMMQLFRVAWPPPPPPTPTIARLGRQSDTLPTGAAAAVHYWIMAVDWMGNVEQCRYCEGVGNWVPGWGIVADRLPSSTQ